MAMIWSACPRCGGLVLDAEQVEIVAVPGRPMDREHGSRFQFTCPMCDRRVRRSLDEETAQALIRVGVQVRPPNHPVFGRRPEPPDSRPPGPPLTPDDLLDLHLLLEEDDWFDRLLELTTDE